MTQSEFQRLIRSVAREGAFHDSKEGTYLRWSPGAGAELWIQANLDREIIGCNPHFTGEASMRIAVTQTFHSIDRPLDGRLFGWVEPEDERNPTTGLYALSVEMPDYSLSETRLFKHPVITVQIAAFAEEIANFPNERSFAFSTFSNSMALPTVLQANSEEDAGEAPVAKISGFVLKAELRTNPLTEQTFLYALLETHGGTVDVVASNDLLPETPAVGSVLVGSFWLSGRLESRMALPRPILSQRAWV